MSEFLAEARVLIRPDTTGFAATLAKEINSAVVKAQAGIKPVVVPVSAVAGAGSAAANKVVKDQVAGQEILGAETTRTSNITREQIAVQNAAAVSAKKLALAQEEIHGAASAASAAQITFTRSTAAVAAAERELALATKSGDEALIIAARESKALAAERLKQAEATLIAARAEQAHAASLSQVQRAFLAQTASAAGLRGAVLSSTTAFLAATVAAVALGKSVKEASDLNEEIDKTQRVFGSSAEAILEWSKTTAGGIGIAETQALQAIGTFGELFRTLDVGTPKAAALSKQLVVLGADLASFFNKSPEQALQAIQSGLVGQARPLRQFGVFLTEARVKAEALIDTGKKNVNSLSQQDRILARYNLILQDSAIASGNFAETQSRLANQSRIARANLSDLGASIGKFLLPTLEIALQDVNGLFEGLKKLQNFHAKIVIDIEENLPGGKDSVLGKIFGFTADLAKPLGLIQFQFKAVNFGLKQLGLIGDDTHRSIRDLGGGFSEMSHDAAGSKLILDGLAASLQRVADAATNAGNRLNTQALTAEAGGASLQQRIALQKKIIENDKILVAQARHTGKAGTIQGFLRQQIADQNTLAALVAQASSQVQDAADKMQTANNNADQAILDSISGGETKRTNAQIVAAATEGKQDDLKADIALRNFYKAAIIRVRNTVKDAQTAKALIATFTTAIITANNAIAADRKAIADSAKQARQADRDRIRESLSLDVQIAQARGDKGAQKKALLAEIAFLKSLIPLYRRGSVQRKQVLLEIANAQKELTDLSGAQKKTNDAAKSFAFSFLQTQQGFAANLLGNLIPGFATGGLVGGSQGATGADGLRQVAGGFEQPRGSVEGAAAVATSRDRGVRPVQVDTTNQILRAILRALTSGRHGAPEARYQNRVAGSNMDTIGGV